MKRGKRACRRRAAAGAAVLVALAAPAGVEGARGLVIHELKSGWYCDGFGETVIQVGDLDGDGVSDLLVGAPYHSYDVFEFDATGQAYLFSGRTGERIATLPNPLYGEQCCFPHLFGASGAALGDIDGDGVPDFAVGVPDDPDFLWPGSVVIYSGANLTVLRELKGQASSDRFGAALAALDDVDGDGFGDLAVGAPSYYVNDSPGPPGDVYIYSSKTWEPVRTLMGTENGARFGTSLLTARNPLTGART
ncbi:MAG: integrin alpha, partial [Candidatus Methylomirabilis sp.]|nr:integrin alpha [Deltaproteobacteria bacterium]